MSTRLASVLDKAVVRVRGSQGKLVMVSEIEVIDREHYETQVVRRGV